MLKRKSYNPYFLTGNRSNLNGDCACEATRVISYFMKNRLVKPSAIKEELNRIMSLSIYMELLYKITLQKITCARYDL